MICGGSIWTRSRASALSVRRSIRPAQRGWKGQVGDPGVGRGIEGGKSAATAENVSRFNEVSAIGCTVGAHRTAAGKLPEHRQSGAIENGAFRAEYNIAVGPKVHAAAGGRKPSGADLGQAGSRQLQDSHVGFGRLGVVPEKDRGIG